MSAASRSGRIVENQPTSGRAGCYNSAMSAIQLEAVATAAALALALLQIIKTLLEVVALLAKRRRRPRRRPRRSLRRSPRAHSGNGPRPAPSRGRAPPAV